MNRRARLILAILATAVSVSAVAQKTWTGATDTAWGTAANWDPAGVPAALDPVIYPSTYTNALVPTATIVAGGLTVKDGAVLDTGIYNMNISGGLTVEAGAVLRKSSGTLTINCVTLTTGGTIEASGLSVSATDSIAINAGGAISASVYAADLEAAATLTINGAVSAAQNVILEANSIEINGVVSADAENIQLKTDTLTIGTSASLSGGGLFKLIPKSAERTIGLGGESGDLSLSSAGIGGLADGFSSIVIGDAASGAITAAAGVSFSDPVSLTSGGDIAIAGLSAANGADSITAQAAGTISITGAVQAGGDLTLTADDLELNAALSGGGVLTLAPNSGRTMAIAASGAEFTVTETELNLLADGFSRVELGAANAGAVSVEAYTFKDSVAIRAAATITIAGAVNTAASGDGIELEAKDSDVIVNAPLSANGDLALAGSSAQINANLNSASGDLTLRVNQLDIAETASVSGSGALTIKPYTLSRPIVVGQSGVSTQLVIDDAAIGRFGSGLSEIIIGGTELLTSGSMLIASAAFSAPVSFIHPGPITVNTESGLALQTTGDLAIASKTAAGTPSSDVSLGGADAIDAAGTLRVTGAAITATRPLEAGGDIELTHSGVLEVQTAIAATGAFTETGTGSASGAGNAVLWQANLTADSASFNRPVVFSGANELSLNAANGLTFTQVHIDSVMLTLAAGSSAITAGDVHCYAPGKTLSLASDLNANNFVLYAGTVNSGGRPSWTLKVAEDLVILGGGYAEDDTESGVTGLFAYDHSARGKTLNAYVVNKIADDNVELRSAVLATGTSISYGASLNDLSGAVFDVGKNFYMNGASLNSAGGAWTLYLHEDIGDSSKAFAEAYNGSVKSCAASDGVGGANGERWVAAAENVTDGGGNSGWAFGQSALLPGQTPVDIAASAAAADPATALIGVSTVSDDYLWIEIDGADGALFENSNNEIYIACRNNALTIHNGTVLISNTYIRIDGLTPISTQGAGDLKGFYAKVAAEDRWNTDATGLSAGAGTDRGRSGESPAQRSIVPNFSVPKATGSLFMALKDNRGNRLKDYAATDKTLTAVADRTRPALIGAAIGRAPHVAPSAPAFAGYEPYDAHNYIELKYSEAINAGPNAAAGLFSLPHDAAVVNWRADTAWNGALSATVGAPTTATEAAGAIGGDLPPALNQFSLAGWLRVTGAQQTANPSARGATPRGGVVPPNAGIEPDGPASNAFYRDSATPDTVRVYIAGWAEDALAAGKSYKWNWPGWVAGLEEPRENCVVPANPNIRDLAGNGIEPTQDPSDSRYGNGGDKETIVIAPLGDGWDTDPPAAAVTHDPADWAARNNEIVAKDNDGSDYIDRVEFHFLDDSSRLQNWATMRGWFNGSTYPPPDGSILSGTLPDTDGGIRSCTLDNPNAFSFSLTRYGSYSTGIGLLYDETVDFPTLFGNASGSPIAKMDDPYFSLTVSENGHWPSQNPIYVVYNAEAGRLTDLAGNLLDSIASSNALRSTEQTPPSFSLSLAALGKTRLYVQLNEAIQTAELPANNVSPFDIINTEDNPFTGFNVQHCLPLDVSEGTTRALELTLDNPATITLLLNGRLKPKTVHNFPDPLTSVPGDGSYLVDSDGYAMPPAETHRVTDLGLGLVEVFMASDGVHEPGLLGLNSGALTVFDGSGELLPEDVSVYCRLAEDESAALPEPLLYFDLNPAANTRPVIAYPERLAGKAFWLPTVLPGFTAVAAPARSAEAEPPIAGLSRTFIVRKADAEIQAGSETQFLFGFLEPAGVGSPPLYAARLLNPAEDSALNLLNFDLWRYKLRGMTSQKGGVTILNNVIDSGKAEKAIIRVVLAKAGLIELRVYSLDGDIVKTLHRSQAASGSHDFSWDGTNAGGRPVARGIYFVRVNAPDLDEIRKIMVIKE